MDTLSEDEKSRSDYGAQASFDDGPGVSGASSRTKHSNIWNYYKEIDDLRGQCLKCKAMLKTNHKSTSGLIRHLKQHPLLNSEFKTKEATKVSAPSKAPVRTLKQLKLPFGEKWSSDHKKAEELTLKIGKWIAGGLHAFSVVEEPLFKDMLNTAQPMYSIPSSHHFSRKVIPNIYLSTKSIISSKILNTLQNSKLASITFTSDLWTSRNNASFISLTLHYLDELFQFQSFFLGTRIITESHTGLEISKQFHVLMEEWNLRDLRKQIYLCTDNARNMKSAVTHLGMSNVDHVPCFAHTLQLTISDAKKNTPGMQEMLKSVRSIIGHFKHSAKATQSFHQRQEVLGYKPLELVQDCETQWNSEYLMLSRLLVNKIPLSEEISASGSIDTLTMLEWKMVESYVELLQPLYEATMEVSLGRVSTASIVIPLVHGLEASLSQHAAQSSRLPGCGNTFAKQLLYSIKSRFPEIRQNDIFVLSMLVDPRFKAVILKDSEKQLAEKKLMAILQSQSPLISKVKDEKDLRTESCASSSNLWAEFDNLARCSNQAQYSNWESNVKKYINGPTIPRSEDPCAWWKDNIHQYQEMEPVVRKYLGIVATEVASECVFSSAGNVVTNLRQNLASNHVEELVFLHQNKNYM